MKKIISLLLVLCLVFCFAGCREKENNESSGYEIDINYYMGAGQISEANYRLGTDPDRIEEDAEAQAQGHTHDDVDGHEGVISYENFDGREAYIVDGFYYCYKTGNEDNGISCIIGTDTVFGFTTGISSKYEINNVLTHLNPESSVAEADEFFYMPFAMEGIEKLTVKNGSNILNFYFENDVFAAACLYSSENWEF